MEEEHAHLEWNHSTGVSNHPSRLCSRRSNFQESNIRLPASTRCQISRCHTLAWFSPRSTLYLTFDLNTRRVIFRVERFTNAHEAFFFFFSFSLRRNRDSSARITITPIRPERRTAINAGSTHTEPSFYARLWRRMSAPAYIFCVISCIQ